MRGVAGVRRPAAPDAVGGCEGRRRAHAGAPAVGRPDPCPRSGNGAVHRRKIRREDEGGPDPSGECRGPLSRNRPERGPTMRVRPVMLRRNAPIPHKLRP